MRLFIFFIGLIFIVSCGSFHDPELLSTDNIEKLEQTKDNILVQSDLSIYNPNWFTISSDDIHFKLFVDTNFIASAEINEGFELIKMDTSNVSAMINIQKSQLDFISNIEDTVLVNVVGSMALPYFDSRYYFDFDYKLNVNEYVLPFANQFIEQSNVQIKEIKFIGVDLFKTSFEVLLSFDNTSSFEYEINNLVVEVYKTESYLTMLGETKLSNSFMVYPDTVNQFKSIVSVKTLSMSSSLFSNSINNSNSFFLKVNLIANYNNIEIPISLNRRIDYNPLTLEIEINE
tara:strand:- start:6697 stop:7560 length:864 start_codon:yes stop_codon:yes gene_type:complete